MNNAGQQQSNPPATTTRNRVVQPQPVTAQGQANKGDSPSSNLFTNKPNGSALFDGGNAFQPAQPNQGIFSSNKPAEIKEAATKERDGNPPPQPNKFPGLGNGNASSNPILLPISSPIRNIENSSLLSNQGSLGSLPEKYQRPPGQHLPTVETPSCGFSGLAPEDFDLYFFSSRLCQLLATKDLASINLNLQKPFIKEKIVVNIKFYERNNIRENWYEEKISPKIADSMLREGRAAQQICNHHPGVQKMLQKIVLTITQWMEIDKLLAYKFVAKELIQTGMLYKFLDHRFPCHIGNYIYEWNNDIMLLVNQPDIEALLQNTCKAVVEDRKALLKSVQSILELDKRFSYIPGRLISQDGLPQKIWDNYMMLSRKVYQVECNQPLQVYLSQQVAKQEFKLSRLLLMISANDIFDVKRRIDMKNIIALLDEQNLCGSSQRLGLVTNPQLTTLQHRLLLRLLPFKEALLRKSTENPNDSSWNALLCDYIRATRSDNLLPYRAILPNIARLYNIDLGQASGSHQDPKSFSNIVKGEHWKQWLELWLERNCSSEQLKDPHKLNFTIGLLKSIMKRSPDGFDRDEYKNVHSIWVTLMNNKDTSRAFEVLSVSLGNRQYNMVNKILNQLLSNHCSNFFDSLYHDMTECFKRGNNLHNYKVSERGIYHYQPLKFLCKCVTINPSSISLLESMMVAPTMRRADSYGGHYLILFLLDCLKYFAQLNSLKSLKWLFRAVTALIKSTLTVQKTAICLSCHTFEDVYSQNFVKIICDKLVSRQTHTQDELKLIKAMLESLIATLSVGTLDTYFLPPDPSYYKFELGDLMQRIASRNNGVHLLEPFQQLHQRREAKSHWLFNLMNVLAIKPISLSYEAADLLLQSLLSQFNDIEDSEYRLLEEGVDRLNVSGIAKHLIELFDVVKTSELANSDIEHSEYRNRLLAENTSQPEHTQTKATLYNAMCLLNTTVKLVRVRMHEHTKSNVRMILDNCRLVRFVEEKFSGKLSLHEYKSEVFTKQGWCTMSINIVTAIVSLLGEEYVPDDEEEIHLNFQDGEDPTELEKLAQFIDIRMINNSLRRPQFHAYLRMGTLYTQVLRLLTNLFLLWDQMPSDPRPYISTILDSRSLSEIKLNLNNRSPVQWLWSTIIKRMHGTSSQFMSILLTIFDFINCSLLYDTKLFEILVSQQQSQPFKQFIVSIIQYTWASSNILCVGKITLMLNLLVRRSEASQTLKKYVDELLFSSNLLERLIASLPADYNEKIRTDVTLASQSNLSRDINIYNTSIYYCSLSMVIRLAIHGVLTGHIKSPFFICGLLEKLYNPATIDKFSKVHRYSVEYEPKMEDLWRHKMSEDRIIYLNQFTLRYQNEEDDPSPSQQQATLKEQVANYLEINEYGYGRLYEINLHKAYEHLKNGFSNRTSTEGMLATVSRYNYLRSLEDIKTDALTNWTHLYTLITSLGKEGYSFSGRLGKTSSVPLRTLQTFFSNHMWLINSKQITLSKDLTAEHLATTSLQSTNSLYVSMCDAILKTLPKSPPKDIARESIKELRNKHNQQYTIIQQLTILQFAFRNLLLMTTEKEQTYVLQKGFQRMMPVLERLVIAIDDCFRLKAICSFFPMLCLVAKRIQPPPEQTQKLCQIAITAYCNPDLHYRNIVALVASPLFIYHRQLQGFQALTNQLVISATKPDFEIMDFVSSMNILTELAPANPLFLVDLSFFDTLRKTLQTADFNQSNVDSTYHQVFLLIFRLAAYTLMSERTDSRLLSDISNFFAVFKDYLVSIVSIKENNRFDYDTKFKITSIVTDSLIQRLRQNQYLINVVTLLIKYNDKRSLSDWLQELVDILLHSSAMACLNRLTGYDPHEEEARLREVVVTYPTSREASLDHQISARREFPLQPELLREDGDVFTLLCTINTFKAVQAYLLFIETLLDGIIVERNWQQIERVLSCISRWLTIKCQDYTSNERSIDNLLKYHRAYIESAEHAFRYRMMDQYTETYTIQEFMGLIGSISYSCHLVCLDFINCVKEIQENHYKDFDLKNFKRQLLNDTSRSIESFRYCQKDIQSYLELPAEKLPLWNPLLELIKYEQS